MSDRSLHVLVVVGSLAKQSATRVVMSRVSENLQCAGVFVDTLDLSMEPLELLNPEESRETAEHIKLKERVDRADVLILGTPDYHGSMSGALKNFLDHFWTEFAGKLFVSLVASNEKGLTVADQVRTVARQCYAWALPYAVSFVDREDVKDGQIVSDAFASRLEMLVRDVRVYGALLSSQRAADLAGTGVGFMARYRPKQS
ncbi:MAG: NADPH-dependent oxidoreductase [Pedosphaera sp.]|nr:NADPH-dependent oxidoreductase [Pedosphaera sp.]